MSSPLNSTSLRFVFRNWVWFEYGTLLIIPLIGIFILRWPIGNIVFLFYYEFLLAGIFTALRMLCAYRADGCFFRLLAPVMFAAAYTCFTFFFLFSMSHLFEIAADKIEFRVDSRVLLAVFLVYVFNFLFGFLFSGHYKETAADKESNETYIKSFFLLAILWIIVIPFHWMNDPQVAAYVLGGGIIIAKSAFGVGYTLYRKDKSLNQ